MAAVGERRLPSFRQLGDPSVAALLAGVAVVALYARCPVASRQFFAEDGQRFFAGARTRGLASFGEAYNGYFHFLPRAIGLIASRGPVPWAATVTWLLTAAVVGWCVAETYLSSARWLRSRTCRSMLALTLVLLPALGYESIGSAANLQFVLVFTSVVVLLGDRRAGWPIVALAGASSLLGVLLVPIVAWRVLTARRVDLLGVGWGLGVLAQFVPMWAVDASREGPHVGLAEIGRGGVEAIQRNLGVSILPAACLLVVGVVLDRRRWMIIGVTVWGAGFFVAESLGRADPFSPPRYDLVPLWCLTFAALVALEVVGDRVPHRQVVVGGCLMLLGIWTAGWPPSEYRTVGPDSWSAGYRAATAECDGVSAVTILPTTWGSWSVPVADC